MQYEGACGRAEEARSWLHEAARVTILTGAGISAESGVPTFRDALDGYWARFRPEELASETGFRSAPEKVWRWYVERRQQLSRLEPNPGHIAIARFVQRHPDTALITQNVDDLHERAGARDVIHLHGELAETRCLDCHKPAPTYDENALGYCEDCRGYLRPGVVWFGEMLPAREWERAERSVTECDLCLCVGTSGLVYPAAELPVIALESGARLIQINPATSELDRYCHINLRAPAGEILPHLLSPVD